MERVYHIISDVTINALLVLMEDGKLALVKEQLTEVLTRPGLSEQDLALVGAFLRAHEGS